MFSMLTTSNAAHGIPAIGEDRLASIMDTFKVKPVDNGATDRGMSEKAQAAIMLFTEGAKQYKAHHKTNMSVEELADKAIAVTSYGLHAVHEKKIVTSHKTWLPHERPTKKISSPPGVTQESGDPGHSEHTAQSVDDTLERAKVMPLPPTPQTTEKKVQKRIAVAPVSAPTSAATESAVTAVQNERADILNGFMIDLGLDLEEFPKKRADFLKLPTDQVAKLGQACAANIDDFVETYVEVDGKLKHGKGDKPIKADWTDALYRFARA